MWFVESLMYQMGFIFLCVKLKLIFFLGDFMLFCIDEIFLIFKKIFSEVVLFLYVQLYKFCGLKKYWFNIVSMMYFILYCEWRQDIL